MCNSVLCLDIVFLTIYVSFMIYFVQVRKKSARLMEMEESDQLEQHVVHRQSRTGARKPRGYEQIVREIPASSLTDEHLVSPGFEKPVKVRFSLGARQDDVDILAVTTKSKSKRDRRKSAAEIKVESDEELVIDEPTTVISPQSSEQSLVLRMKLNMDPSGVSSFVQTQDSHSVCHFSFFYFYKYCIFSEICFFASYSDYTPQN